MPTYYVGLGGNDGNDGLTWANRFLTLNGAEDEPVIAGDTVWVAPGVYRELLTCDVSGSSGNPITYVGDATGENTDGIGGIVRITGSNDDQTASRAYCINSTSIIYRTFRGFTLDSATNTQLYTTGSIDGWIIEDCYFGDNPDNGDGGFYSTFIASDLFIIRRCVFAPPGNGIYFSLGAELSADASSIIENCAFVLSGVGIGIQSQRSVGYSIKNCLFYGRSSGVYHSIATTGTIDINNCLFANCSWALNASASGDIIEDYNSIPLSNTTPRLNVATGGNSNTYPALLETPLLLDGIQFPWNMLVPSKWSQIARIAGSGESTDDLYGQTRPATSAKISWGAAQFQPGTRETTTTRGSSAASIAFADAGRHQIFVPVTAVSTTIAVYVNREANYAGTNPQMVIKEPGQADRTTTDAAAVSQWNELTDTFTPSGDVDYVVVELASSNTATSGSYGAYFDDLAVS